MSAGTFPAGPATPTGPVTPTGPAPGGRSAIRAAARRSGEPGRTVAEGLRPSRAQIEDLVGVAALVGVALVGWRTSFSGPTWVLAGCVGVVLGLGVAHVVAALRLPGAVTAVGLLAAYLLVGPALTAKDGLTPPSVLLGTAVQGWKQLLTTLPPVESRGPLVALPLLFALVGAGTAYGVACRWPGAVRALLVPLGLLVLSLLLGTMTPASVFLQGLVFALVALGYAAVRAARGRSALQNGAGRTTRAVTAAALLGLAAAGALVLGPRLPGAQSNPRTVWRTALEPPFDLAQFPSPLAGFRRYTEPNPAALYDRALLAVEGLPTGSPLRLATLDSYDGSVWGASAAAAAFRRIGSRLATTAPPTLAQQSETAVTVTVPEGGWSDVWLPTVGATTGLDFDGPRADGLREDLRYNADTGTGLVPARLAPGDVVHLTAYLPTDAARAGELPGTLALARGSRLDVSALGFLDAKLDAWAGQEADPWRRLVAVAAAMRGAGAYTDGGAAGDYQNVYLPGHSLSRITRFVKAPQLAGDDEQYAATLALAAARMGVPSRVVLGAITDPTGVVRGRDVHAWVEVLRADGQWQPILASQFVPDRNKKPTQQEQTSDQRTEGAVVPPPAANNPPSILQGPDQAQNSALNKAPQSKKSLFDPSTWPDWLRWAAQWLGPPVALVGLVVALILGAKARRRRHRRTRGTPATRVEGAWAELVDTATDLRMPLPANATRVEQARALTSDDPAGLLRVAERADGLVFGAAAPNEADTEGLWQGVGAVIDGLRSGVTRGRRIRGALSLRSLRPTRTAGPRRRVVRLSATARRLARLRRVTGEAVR